MMSLSFPSIPQIAELTPQEYQELFSGELSIEEKVDGANLGILFDENANLVLQNRGAYLVSPFEGQFQLLSPWLNKIRDELFDVLEDRFILFGEWCLARHSIEYDKLPDWFLAFDIFDRRAESFVHPLERDKLVAKIDLQTVPRLQTGHCDLETLERLLSSTQSKLRVNGPMEGVVLRPLESGHIVRVAKLVRPDFTQSIEVHWTKGELIKNKVQYA